MTTRKSTVVLLIFIAMNATVAVRAQQSPSTTPTTVAAVPAVTQTPQAAPAATPVTAAAPAQAKPAAQPVQYVQYVQTQQAQYQPAQQVQYAQPAAAGDAYGFTNWLNGVRAQYGLPGVGYDANLEAWANANNAQQNARGIGHFVMGPARRQNSAMGNYASIGAMWMASPAHRAALLDPSIRFVGIAGSGA
jgi:uncharacterized protein YkwD